MMASKSSMLYARTLTLPQTLFLASSNFRSATGSAAILTYGLSRIKTSSFGGVFFSGIFKLAALLSLVCYYPVSLSSAGVSAN